jgi:hypothetical protein
MDMRIHHARPRRVGLPPLSARRDQCAVVVGQTKSEETLRTLSSILAIVLLKLSPLFDELYSGEERGSIPPKQLLKARVRSE